jgi:hypothetical protein
MKKYILLLIVIFLTFSCLVKEKNEANHGKFPHLVGPYLGQTPPGTDPKLFAPGIISTPMYTRDVAMTPDGNEFYFCVSALGYNLIFYSKIEQGRWTEPQAASFITDDQYMYYEPHITPDGKKLMFLSNQPIDSSATVNEDIWAVDRSGDSWGNPYNLGLPVNTKGAEFFPSTTRSGTLYFTRQPAGERVNYIYRSKLVNGKYMQPEKLGPEINCGQNRYNAFIDPDERFIIVPATGMPDSRGGTDYYIVFRNESDQWNQPINMGDKVNTRDGREYSPYISPDAKYFFFMSARTDRSDQPITFTGLKQRFSSALNGNANIYWMDASFIEKLKP